MESLKLWASALMGFRKTDGSIDWMMTGFVWVFTLLILVAIIAPILVAVNKKKKSKFDTKGFEFDTPLQILIRSGLPEEQAFERSQTFFGYLQGKGANVEVFSYENDPSLQTKTQIVYMGGFESFFQRTPSGTLIGYAAEPGKDNTDLNIIVRYTNPAFKDYQFASTDAQPNTFVRSMLTSSGKEIITYVQDSSLPADVVVMRLIRAGSVQPDKPIEPWYNEYKKLPLEVLRFSKTKTSFTQADSATIEAAIGAARVPKPTPVFKPTFLIECPPALKTVADQVAEMIKRELQRETTGLDVVVEANSTKPHMNVILESVDSNIKWYMPIQHMTMPLVLVHAPANLAITANVYFAFESSWKMYNEQLKQALQIVTPKDRSGPAVIRLEGDADPVLLRGRLELLNLFGEKERTMPVVVKYIQNKNPKRPNGTVSAYIESFDQNRVRQIVDTNVLGKITKEFPSGTFLGNTKTYFVVNGITTNPKSSLTGSDELVLIHGMPLLNFVQGTGQKPNEDTVLADLGCPPPLEPIPCPSCPPPPPPTVCPPEKVCPTPPPCPSCPPEKVCPTPPPCPSCPPEKICPKPDPCPSCPLWDPAKKAPVGNDVQIVSNTGMSNRTRLLPTLVELIRVRLAFANKTANFTYANSSGSGTNSANSTSIRIKYKSYNKLVAYPTTDAAMRTLVDTIVADLTPLLA
jgi:hypothetical protein